MTVGGLLGIKGALVKRVRDALLAACQTDVERNNVSYAAVVDVGSEYTGEMDLDRVVILSHDTHPKRPNEWADGARDFEQDLGFVPPDKGRGMTGYRRFTVLRGSVQARLNLSGNGDRPEATQEEALEIRQTVQARVRDTLDTDSSLVGFFDDYGNAVQIFNLSRITSHDLVGPNQEIYFDWAALATVPTRQRS